MTVTSNEQGQMNMWATEPRMYIDKTAAERYGHLSFYEELLHSI